MLAWPSESAVVLRGLRAVERRGEPYRENLAAVTSLSTRMLKPRHAARLAAPAHGFAGAPHRAASAPASLERLEPSPDRAAGRGCGRSAHVHDVDACAEVTTVRRSPGRAPGDPPAFVGLTAVGAVSASGFNRWSRTPMTTSSATASRRSRTPAGRPAAPGWRHDIASIICFDVRVLDVPMPKAISSSGVSSNRQRLRWPRAGAEVDDRGGGDVQVLVVRQVGEEPEDESRRPM